MSIYKKISPAFKPFMAEGSSSDKSEAVVIYKPTAIKALPKQDRLSELKKRLDDIKDSTKEKTRVNRLVKKYQKSGQDMLGGKKTLQGSTIGSPLLPVASVEVTRKTLSLLEQQDDVVAVMPNQKISLLKPMEVNYGQLVKQEVNDGLTWGLKQMDIPRMWEETTGSGVNVAVLDTGVYGEHHALAGKVKDFIMIDPLGRRISALPTFDGGNHGTHVCGAIAGGKTPDDVSIGVAPGANLLVAAVLAGDATLTTLLKGISWAIEKEADVINMSLGFSYYEPKFAEVFRILVQDLSILPVVAIGNENHGNSSSPGNAPGGLAVGAVEKMPRNKYEVAFFSSGASLNFPGQEPNSMVIKPDVAAPGVQVYSCVPPENKGGKTREYAYMDGTSMATPHVAGVAALLLSAKQEAMAGDIIKALTQTASHPNGDNRPDNRWGWGMVNPWEALKAL